MVGQHVPESTPKLSQLKKMIYNEWIADYMKEDYQKFKEFYFFEYKGNQKNETAAVATSDDYDLP